MKITLEFDSQAEAAPVLALLAGVPAGVTVAGTSVDARGTEQPARRRRTKAEMAEAAAQAEAPPAPAPEPQAPPAAPASDWDEEEPEATPAKQYTRDDVRAALVAYQGRSSQEKAQGLLKSVGGVEKLGALPEGKYAEVIKAAETAK